VTVAAGASGGGVVPFSSNFFRILPSPAIVITTRGGRAIIASANKNGLLSALDRGRLADLPVLWERAATTRENVDAPLSRDSVVRLCPRFNGGVEWNGAAYSPQTNLLYVGAVDWCSRVQLKRRPSGHRRYETRLLSFIGDGE
jgi:hypothetical protein